MLKEMFIDKKNKELVVFVSIYLFIYVKLWICIEFNKYKRSEELLELIRILFWFGECFLNL